jgi:hypothetical protein
MLLVRWSQFILTRYSKLSKWDLMQIQLVIMVGAYSKPLNISLVWYYIKQIMNVFICSMVRTFSFGERWNVPFNSAVASLNGTFHLSPNENVLTIALINIHYLFIVTDSLLLWRHACTKFTPKWPIITKSWKKSMLTPNFFSCIILLWGKANN